VSKFERGFESQRLVFYTLHDLTGVQMKSFVKLAMMMPSLTDVSCVLRVKRCFWSFPALIINLFDKLALTLHVK
jgi:hypothetical protein